MKFQNQSSVRLRRLAKAATYLASCLRGEKSQWQDLAPFKEELDGLDSTQLIELAEAAIVRSEYLKSQEPAYDLALMKGVKDNSYSVQRGYVYSYSGEAEIILENGQKWHALGRSCGGNAHYAVDGYIEFIPVNL